METLVKTNTSRNMWTIMKEFKVLPTNPDFQALTDDQVGFIIGNMNKDAEIAALIAKGIDPDSQVTDSDTTWWDTPIDEFDPKGNLDIDESDIAKQLEELTSEDDRRKLAKISEGNQEWADYLEEEGNANEMLSTEHIIQENLRKAMDEAKMLESTGTSNWGKPRVSEEEEKKAAEFEPLTQEGIEEAFKLFEGQEDVEEDTGPDSDWI